MEPWLGATIHPSCMLKFACSELCSRPSYLETHNYATYTQTRTDLVETSAYPNPGLFIDTDNPAVCSGQITAWNVCYYNNPRSFTQLNTLQISLQIWRFDEPIRNSVRVDEHVETVTIPETPENFQCITAELSPDEYMNVSTGDLVGVLLVMDAVLPVVGNTLNDSTASLLYSVSIGPN